MKKAIQICSPVLAILAIACDSPQLDVDGASENTQRSGEETDVQANVKAAGKLLKAHRVLDLLTTPESLNPFAKAVDPVQAMADCEITTSDVVEEVESACDGFYTYAYVVEFDNCNIGDHDSVSGTMYVSSTQMATLESPVQAALDQVYRSSITENNAWAVDIELEGYNGSEITACGNVSQSGLEMNRDFIATIPGALEDTVATYEFQSTQTDGSFRAERLEMAAHLIASDNDDEIPAMNSKSIGNDDDTLIPGQGFSRVEGIDRAHVAFSPEGAAAGGVSAADRLRHQEVVVIPAL